MAMFDLSSIGSFLGNPAIGGAMGLMSLFGGQSPEEKARAAMLQKQGRVADQQYAWSAQHMPLVLQALRSQALGKTVDPTTQAARTTALAGAEYDSNRAFQQAAGMLGQRGLTPGGSNIYSGAMGMLARSKSATLGNMRTGFANQDQSARNAALAQLGGMVSPMGQQAAGNYSNLATSYGQTPQEDYSGLANLVSMLMQAQRRTSGGITGGTGNTTNTDGGTDFNNLPGYGNFNLAPLF